MRACLGPHTSRGTTVRLNRLSVVERGGPESDQVRGCRGVIFSMGSRIAWYAHRASFGLQILDGRAHRRWWTDARAGTW